MCCETIKDGSFYNPLNQGYSFDNKTEEKINIIANENLSINWYT